MGWTKFSAGKYCASCESDGRGPLADYFVADRNGGIVRVATVRFWNVCNFFFLRRNLTLIGDID